MGRTKKENENIAKAKKDNKKYKSTVLENDETPRQLLTRSRYVFAKKEIQ